MTGDTTRGARTARRALGAAVVLLWAYACPAGAQEIHGLLSTSYSGVESNSSDGARADFRNLRETLDLNWNKRISDTLGYRLTFRGERLDGTNKLSAGGVETSTESSALLLEPALDVTLAAAPYSLNAGLRLRELFTEQGQGENVKLSERNGFLRFFYSPEQLPSIGLLLDRTTSVNDRLPAPRDEVDTRYQLLSNYSLRDLRLSYMFGRRVHEDHREQQMETQDSHTGSAGYSGRFFDDRLAVQADLSLNYTRTVDEFFAPGTARLSRALARGLRADPDPSPGDSSDFPLTDTPALLSGTANIPLLLQSAVGFGLAAPEQVAEIEITLAPEPPFVLPPNLASFVAFRVFHSDNQNPGPWTEVAVASQAWDPVRSRFTVIIPATSARFFKALVSQNTFGALVKATGIAAPVTTAVIAGSERSRTTRGGTAGVGLTYTPVKWLTAAYNGTMSTSVQEPEAIEATSGTHTASLTVRPHRLVTTTGTAQYAFSESNQPGALGTTQTSYSLSVGWIPLQTLSTTLAMARNENRLGSALQDRTDTGNLTAAAKVFPGLNLDSTFALTKADNFTTHQSVVGQDVAFKMAGQMTPWASVVGSYAMQIRETTPPPAGSDATTVTHSVGGGTVYTLSRLVNFTTRFDFVAMPDGNSLAQQYKLDWVPTSKTSFYASYVTSSGHLGDAKSSADAISLNGRWSVNQALDISTNYSFSRSQTDSTVQDVQTFNVTASVRF